MKVKIGEKKNRGRPKGTKLSLLTRQKISRSVSRGDTLGPFLQATLRQSLRAKSLAKSRDGTCCTVCIAQKGAQRLYSLQVLPRDTYCGFSWCENEVNYITLCREHFFIFKHRLGQDKILKFAMEYLTFVYSLKSFHSPDTLKEYDEWIEAAKVNMVPQDWKPSEKLLSSWLGNVLAGRK